MEKANIWKGILSFLAWYMSSVWKNNKNRGNWKDHKALCMSIINQYDLFSFVTELIFNTLLWGILGLYVFCMVIIIWVREKASLSTLIIGPTTRPIGKTRLGLQHIFIWEIILFDYRFLGDRQKINRQHIFSFKENYENIVIFS